MWWTTQTYVWEEKKQKKQVMRLRVTVEDRYCNTLMTFDPSGSPNVKYFNLFWKPTMWLCIRLMLILTLYLASFARNSASEFPVIDLWPSTLTEGQIFYLFWNSQMWLHISFVLIRTLHLAPFARYPTSKVLVKDLDPSGLPKVKYFNFFGSPCAISY